MVMMASPATEGSRALFQVGAKTSTWKNPFLVLMMIITDTSCYSSYFTHKETEEQRASVISLRFTQLLIMAGRIYPNLLDQNTVSRRAILPHKCFHSDGSLGTSDLKGRM